MVGRDRWVYEGSPGMIPNMTAYSAAMAQASRALVRPGPGAAAHGRLVADAFTRALPQVLAEGHYEIQADTLEAGSFELHAVPQGGQEADTECQTLTLDSRSERGVADGATKDAAFCWGR